MLSGSTVLAAAFVSRLVQFHCEEAAFWVTSPVATLTAGVLPFVDGTG